MQVQLVSFEQINEAYKESQDLEKRFGALNFHALNPYSNSRGLPYILRKHNLSGIKTIEASSRIVNNSE